jgi:penicillin-binding protein 2
MRPLYKLGLLLTLIVTLRAATNEALIQNPQPTWETQQQARTFQFLVPAPRGQITDRHGEPLAQSRVGYNLSLQFPTPLLLTDQKVIAFAREYIAFAQGILKHQIAISDATIVNHYRHRGLLPLNLIENLSPEELLLIKERPSPYLTVRESYLRYYPHNRLASHLIGYTGRQAPLSTRLIENGDFLFAETEGREGIEQVFDSQLRGSPGSFFVTYDQEGKKSSERLAQAPIPGNSVITTIDLNLQSLCEKVLQENCKRGAIVFIDPASGEIVAMASQPGFNPNIFVPVVSSKVFEQLTQDPNVPLLPRSFRSAYPPGSSFKTVIGVAALQSGAVTAQDTFPCPPTLAVGNLVFHNWKKTDAGKLNFVQAFTQSCNTWFYQCGLRMKAEPIIDWAHRLGLGRRTGIPLRGEAKGNIPDNDYMMRVQHRTILSGDIANMSIGQGDILITPLQMAQEMAILASGGVFHQTRLVKQIQTPDNRVVAAYPDRIRADLRIRPDVLATLREAMVDVTEDAYGTAHRAQVPGMHVAGKTGTAQWGPTNRQRTAAWFIGFVPADHPQYAFAAVYEGEPNDNSIHGGSQAAPMIGKVLQQLFGKQREETAPPRAIPVAAPSDTNKSLPTPSPTQNNEEDLSN